MYPVDQPAVSELSLLRIDNTRRSCAVDCLRKYYYQHILGLQPRLGSSALRYGTVWHAMMDAFYSHVQKNGWIKDGKAIEAAILVSTYEWQEESKNREFYEDYRTHSNLLDSFMRYVSFFSADEGFLTVLATERYFEIPIVPETREESSFCINPFLFTGQIDLEILLGGRPWILDFKSTGKPITTVTKTLRRDPQFIGYSYAASKTLPTSPDGFLVSIHHLSATKSKKTELYGTPKIDFYRVPELYTPYDISQWRLSLIKTASELQHAYRTNVWPMQQDSCHHWGSCSYSMLCEQQRPLDNLILGDNFITCPIWDVRQASFERNLRRENLLKEHNLL